MTESRQRVLNFDILIQDPLHDCAFLVPGDEIGAYEVDREAAGRAPAGTVTFSVSGAAAVEEMPDAPDAPVEYPSVLIRYPDAEAAFLLSYDDLRQFEQEMHTDVAGFGPNYGIAYTLPYSRDLVQSMPAVQMARLQSCNKARSFDPGFSWRMR
jgi:hypothetical protein